jgi:hypothetical protein
MVCLAEHQKKERKSCVVFNKSAGSVGFNGLLEADTVLDVLEALDDAGTSMTEECPSLNGSIRPLNC